MSFTAAADQPTAKVRLLTSADSGASYQVRGLRGNEALARWLEQQMQGGARRCRASAASGVVRLHGATHEAARRQLEHCIDEFAPTQRRTSATVHRRAAPTVQQPTAPQSAPQRKRPTMAPGDALATPAEPAPSMTRTSWHALDRAQIIGATGSRLDGLSGRQAQLRLQRHGPNEISDVGGRG